jgi:Rrf2 family protein
MKLITRDTDYAIRALLFLARQRDRTVSVTDLVGSLKIPRPFLRKIMQTMNKKGVLSSHKGNGGGFRLARPADQIFILDLVRIFQGSTTLNQCLFKKRLCPDRSGCPLKKKIESLEKYVFSELRKTTIAGLVEGGGTSWPKEKL